MLQIAKKLLIVLILTSMFVLVVHAAKSDSSNQSSFLEINPLIENLKFESSRYSQPEDMRLIDSEDYVEITRNDDLVLENNNYGLYLNEETLGMKILNKNNDYIWSTAIDNADAGNYSSLLESGVGFEYINLTQNYSTKERIGLTDTEFVYDMTLVDNKIIFDIEIGGFCTTRMCSRFYDSYLDGNFTLEEMIEYGFTELEVGFTLEVTLTEDGIEAYVPYDSIYEGKPEVVQFSSIILFPSLGATYLDDIPGYMMIPDGVGALIRYEDKEGRFQSPYVGKFYGTDYGSSTSLESSTDYRLSMPIFGAVHGVNQNGFLGIIESGASNASLFAFPNGAGNINYNLIFTKFVFKETYRQTFTTDRSGGAMRIYESSKEDIKVRYDFNDGEKSNYVGLARIYQNYLVENEIINSFSNNEQNIPIHLQFLMADSKNRFIGKEIVEMTNVNDVRNIYDFFVSEGLDNQRVSLLGWNDGGYSGNLPSDVDFENKLGRNKAFKTLIEHITNSDSLMLVNNYIVGSNGTNRLSYRTDVAEGINQYKLELSCGYCVYNKTYLLYPEYSYNRAMSDLEDYKDYNVEVLFESLGSFAFSYYDKITYSRNEAIDIYENIIEQYAGIANYNSPNSYAFKGMNGYYNTPSFNNQFNYFDDLVPIIPIVLSGHVEMFSQFLNYNSLGKTQLLMLIDFGINPAYILTQERPSNLTGTDVEYFYSSQFEVWKESILIEYMFMNDALKHVQGESIVNRNVLDFGVVEVSYSNNVKIIINYTNDDYNFNGTTISPLDYLVRGEADA